MTDPLRVFISYAHEDDAHRLKLGNHLSTLVDERLIQLWHDHMITGGREWQGVIADELTGADIVLLLVSASFLASDYCNDVELTEAIRLHDAGQTRVVPVILRSCDWKHSRFARFGALPPGGMPILEGSHPDRRFTAVAAGLRAVVAELRGLPPVAPCPVGAVATEGLVIPSAIDPRSKQVRSRNGTVAPTALTPKAPAAEFAPAAPRTLKIGQIRLFGFLEIGPFDLSWPPGRIHALPILIAVLLLLGAAAGVYRFALKPPVADARAAMRMARYDRALTALATVPGWLAWWPEVGALLEKADLGKALHDPPQDWSTLGMRLARLRASDPADADLMVLDATMALRDQSYEQARKTLDVAVQADQANAEAWFLLGLLADLAGDVRTAITQYRKAVALSPQSPQYRSNLARALLDSDRVDESIQEYRKISQFPLARVEEALGHWAKGELQGGSGPQKRSPCSMTRESCEACRTGSVGDSR